MFPSSQNFITPSKTGDQANSTNAGAGSAGRAQGATSEGMPSSGYQMQFHGQSMVNVFCHPGNYTLNNNIGGSAARWSGYNSNNPNPNRQVRFAPLPTYEPRKLSDTPPRMPQVATPYPGKQQINLPEERNRFFDEP